MADRRNKATPHTSGPDGRRRPAAPGPRMATADDPGAAGAATPAKPSGPAIPLDPDGTAAAPAAIAFRVHDHGRCAEQVLCQADAMARARGLRLTPVRRRTLEILLEAHRAMGAYEVLDRLAVHGHGHQPPVAYRALDFLVEHGLAHRIQRLNAYAACMAPGALHRPVFLICRCCNSVAELPGQRAHAAFEAAAAETGFAVERATIEAVGLCPACRDAA